MCLQGETIPLMSSVDDEDNEDGSCDGILEKCIDSIPVETAWKLAIILALGNAADAIEILCIGFIMNELNTSTEEKEFLSAAVFLGMLVGGLLCGILSDKLGRKPCLMISLSLNAIAGIASALAPSVEVLIACRICGGLGIGGSVPSVFTLGAEIFPTAQRGRLLSVVAS
jgi:MFS family permease